MKVIISKQSRKFMEKLMLDHRGELRIWAKVLPWIVIAWVSLLVSAFAWSLIR